MFDWMYKLGDEDLRVLLAKAGVVYDVIEDDEDKEDGLEYGRRF